MEIEAFTNAGFLTVTDGYRTERLPFRQGESVLSVLQRYLLFSAPCRGNGTCGQCRFDIIRADGSLKPELACMYTAKEMTVKIPLVRRKDIS